VADSPLPHVSLGAAARAIRLERDLTQEEVADRSGLHATWISRFEAGTINPTWNTVVRLAQGLGLTPEELAARAARAR
jgi:transcriptional regulator with XRE-family HTH domain